MAVRKGQLQEPGYRTRPGEDTQSVQAQLPHGWWSLGTKGTPTQAFPAHLSELESAGRSSSTPVHAQVRIRPALSASSWGGQECA